MAALKKAHALRVLQKQIDAVSGLQDTYHGSLEFNKWKRDVEIAIDRFNRSYREAVLDMFVFQSLQEVREQTEQWLKEYNEERPHDALGDLTPREYLLTHKPEISINSRA